MAGRSTQWSRHFVSPTNIDVLIEQLEVNADELIEFMANFEHFCPEPGRLNTSREQPMVVLSSFNEASVLNRCLCAFGANSYLVKLPVPEQRALVNAFECPRLEYAG